MFIQITTSFECKQMCTREKERENGWMHEPEAMRAKGDVNIQLYLVFSFSVFFFLFAFRSVNVYNLKAYQL